MDLRSLSNSDRGLYCEYLVYRRVLRRNYQFLAHRFKTPMAEIDLLFRVGERALMIEVKSSSNDDFIFARVGSRQKSKLRAARVFLESRFKEVQLVLALVSHDGAIEVIEDF